MVVVVLLLLLMLLHYAIQREVVTAGKGPLSGRWAWGREVEIVTVQGRVVCTWTRKRRRTDRHVQGKDAWQERGHTM